MSVNSNQNNCVKNFVNLQFTGPQPCHVLWQSNNSYEQDMDYVTCLFGIYEKNRTEVAIDAYIIR
jgi:hypothetical protein